MRSSGLCLFLPQINFILSLYNLIFILFLNFFELKNTEELIRKRLKLK